MYIIKGCVVVPENGEEIYLIRDTTRQNEAKSKGRETHICIKREKKIPKECFAKLFRSMKNGERDKLREGEIRGDRERDWTWDKI